MGQGHEDGQSGLSVSPRTRESPLLEIVQLHLRGAAQCTSSDRYLHSAIQHEAVSLLESVPDPSAEAVNVFQRKWPTSGLDLYPPWRLILPVL